MGRGKVCSKIGLLFAGAILLAMSGSVATAEDVDDEYPRTELIHSDIPLFSFQDEAFWPRSYNDPETIASCVSAVGFGDWLFTPNPRNQYEDSSWYRFENYGVFHCAAILSLAGERDELDQAKSEYGYFVRLGEMRTRSGPVELWAIQSGVRPGSTYTLLSRVPSDGIVHRFTLLQQDCPSVSKREASSKSLDIWITRYCAINDRRELLALAKRMAQLDPLGMLELVPENQEAPESNSGASNNNP